MMLTFHCTATDLWKKRGFPLGQEMFDVYLFEVLLSHFMVVQTGRRKS